MYAIQADMANQLLGGVSWTSRRDVHVLAEVWYDGAAPWAGFWEQVTSKQDVVRRLFSQPGTAMMSYGISRSSADELVGTSIASVRRTNMFVRTSWRVAAWEPGVDVLYTPVDGGLVATAKVTWQGSGLRVDAGARFFGGRSSSLYAQLPSERVLYVGAQVRF